jgi:hypothetical protein
MPIIVFPIFTSSNILFSIIASFAVICLVYLPLFFVGYVDEKFYLNLGNGGRWLFGFIIIFFIIAFWMINPILIVLVLLEAILVMLFPLKGEKEGYIWKKKAFTGVIISVGLLILILSVFFAFSDVSSMISKSQENTRIQENTRDSPRFEIRIVNSSGVTTKILGTSKIENVSNPEQSFSDGPWSVAITFTDEGAIAYQKAIIESGAIENPNEHPISIFDGVRTDVSWPISKDLADELKQRPVKVIEISTGNGKGGWAIAMNIMYAIRESHGNS